jgi:hypothetical protein
MLAALISDEKCNCNASLERFRAKWVPVRVKKTRQNKRLEPPFRFNRNGKGSRIHGSGRRGLAFRRACLREVDGVTRNKRCRADSRYLDDVVRRHKCRFVRHDLLGRVAVPSKNDEVPPLAVW